MITQESTSRTSTCVQCVRRRAFVYTRRERAQCNALTASLRPLPSRFFRVAQSIVIVLKKGEASAELEGAPNGRASKRRRTKVDKCSEDWVMKKSRFAASEALQHMVKDHSATNVRVQDFFEGVPGPRGPWVLGPSLKKLPGEPSSSQFSK